MICEYIIFKCVGEYLKWNSCASTRYMSLIKSEDQFNTKMQVDTTNLTILNSMLLLTHSTLSKKFSTKNYIHLWYKLSKSRNRRNIPQHNKSYIWQTHSKHYPQWRKIESISSKVMKKTRVPTLTTTVQHSFGSFGHSNQSRKRDKRNSDWKRSKTLCLQMTWSST